MKVTREILLKIMPNARKEVDSYLSWLNLYAPVYEVNTAMRWCHYLAQVAVESVEMQYAREIASGAAYDTGKLAVRLGNTPEKDGDGEKYKGGGLLDVTGEANYKRLSAALKIDFVTHPELIETPHYAVLSSFWFWKFGTGHDLNLLADKDEYTRIRELINGGHNGLKQGLGYLGKAKRAFGILKSKNNPLKSKKNEKTDS